MWSCIDDFSISGQIVLSLLQAAAFLRCSNRSWGNFLPVAVSDFMHSYWWDMLAIETSMDRLAISLSNSRHFSLPYSDDCLWIMERQDDSFVGCHWAETQLIAVSSTFAECSKRLEFDEFYFLRTLLRDYRIENCPVRLVPFQLSRRERIFEKLFN
jgi:hypothetical protein